MYHPDDINQRAELIAKTVAKNNATGDPSKEFIFALAIRHVREVRAIKNLSALDAAITLRHVKLDKAKRIIADAAHWITEPNPSDIKYKATEQMMAEAQFLRLLSTIEAAAKENVAPEILAAVVAECGTNLKFYKADKSQLDGLQRLIGNGNPNANRVILEYRADRT